MKKDGNLYDDEKNARFGIRKSLLVEHKILWAERNFIVYRILSG